MGVDILDPTLSRLNGDSMKIIWLYRTGAVDSICASCHGNQGQYLPNRYSEFLQLCGRRRKMDLR